MRITTLLDITLTVYLRYCKGSILQTYPMYLCNQQGVKNECNQQGVKNE
jgi:hypothetical protein